MPKKFTIITPYHFGPERQDDYGRLIRSLRASLREVDGKGRVILVANGTEEGAGEPSKVISDLSVSNKAAIEVVKLRKNAGSIGGLNAGIESALSVPTTARGDEWIGKVDSSAVLGSGWLNHIQKELKTSSADAAFGRQLLEGDVSRIYSDGHTLESGLTKDWNYCARITQVKRVHSGVFPCLGACVFRRRLVERVVDEYGNFVCENLAHYGPCTDVALRARAVDRSFKFVHCHGAIAHKRHPIKNYRNIAISQLLAAKFYYVDDKNEKTVRESIRTSTDRYEGNFVDIKREAMERAAKPYSLTGKGPPKANDLEWGA